ncbi:NnrU family protein [Sphingomonas sp. RB56-2]|uniref:NnrU family protein n=1 Tax=Sphingomonas brevis TaxID=2908206 RepID=A0ABT0S7P8_9SPHN|nr:NnrU family protein [Sphingomonas brevis]MCL6740426.1 NnrU family protein [Sphingomonas brevis]
MTALTMLVVASMAFVGTHFLMSHPLRAGMVKAMGEAGFTITYSIVSILTLGWMIWAYPKASAEAPAPLWDAGEAGFIVATVLIWLGSVLFMGSLRRNPALPRPGKRIEKIDDPNGVYAITRHPMMWGFALWAIVHAIVNPTLASLVLSFAIAFLALVGAALQDKKKEMLLGELWADWKAKTSFVPYGKGLKSADAFALVTGTLVWLGATWVHNPPVGVWAFIG